jgi:hypothetical protein
MATGEIDPGADLRSAECDCSLRGATGKSGTDENHAAIDPYLTRHDVRADQARKVHRGQMAADEQDRVGGVAVDQVQRQPRLDLGKVESASHPRATYPHTARIRALPGGPRKPVQQDLPDQLAPNRTVGAQAFMSSAVTFSPSARSSRSPSSTAPTTQRSTSDRSSMVKLPTHAA